LGIFKQDTDVVGGFRKRTGTGVQLKILILDLEGYIPALDLVERHAVDQPFHQFLQFCNKLIYVPDVRREGAFAANGLGVCFCNHLTVINPPHHIIIVLPQLAKVAKQNP